MMNLAQTGNIQRYWLEGMTLLLPTHQSRHVKHELNQLLAILYKI